MTTCLATVAILPQAILAQELSRSKLTLWQSQTTCFTAPDPSVCNPAFSVFVHPFCVMATGRAGEDAMRTSLTGSPPLSSNVVSPYGSGHDLDGMGTRSGNTMDEKLGALLSKFVHFETQIAQIPAITTWMSRMDSHITKTFGNFCDQTYRDGTEFQHPHRSYVQVRDICCLCIKCFRFGKILAYSRTS